MVLPWREDCPDACLSLPRAADRSDPGFERLPQVVDPGVLRAHLGARSGHVIEPGTAGGATLTASGLRWLIDREGGKPVDKPAAVKIAKEHVRTSDEAARLPRAEVYGVSRGS